MTQTKIGVGMINATSIGDAKVLQGDGSWVTPSAGALTFINTTDISSAATYNFTAVDASSYDAYRMVLMNVIPVTDTVIFYMRTSTDGGSSYDSGSSDYRWSNSVSYDETTTTLRPFDYADAQIVLTSTTAGTHSQVGSESNEDGVSGYIDILGPHLTKTTTIIYRLGHLSASTFIVTVSGAANRISAADVDAWQFYFSSGNIESGTVNVYGLANA